MAVVGHIPVLAIRYLPSGPMMLANQSWLSWMTSARNVPQSAESMSIQASGIAEAAT
jgi:hypothetical protein